MRLLNWICMLQVTEACGVGVHLELVERLLPILPDRIAQHYNYVRSGAFYPDAFYNCMGQYDVAEDAHWPPFLANGIELVRKRQREGQDTAKLEAFLVGILSHQVSDVSWHSLGIFEGLLRAMAETEFNGDYNKAHSVLDIGGDMILLSRRAVKESKSTKWEYDVDDVQALLHANNYTDIPERSIRYCMARGHAAYSAELRVANIGFKRYARQSPMLFDELESYFAGGMTDMHEQIEECMPQLFQWIAKGSQNRNPWSICPVFQGAQLDPAHPMSDAETPPESYAETPPESYQHEGTASDEQQLLKDEEFWKRFSETDDPATIFTRDDDDLHVHCPRRRSIDISSYFNTQNAGKLVELFTDIVTQGRNKVLPPCDVTKLSCSYLSAPPRLPSPPVFENHVADEIQPSFGQSLLFWNDLLVIGAPAEGRVYIYNGSTAAASSMELVAAVTPTVSPKTYGKFTARFGASLAIWEETLVVSSPGKNQLDFFDQFGNWVGGIQFNTTAEVYGSRGYKLIGETLAVDELARNRLYVGAPYVDIIDNSVHISNQDGIEHDDYGRRVDRSKDQVGVVIALDEEIFTQALNRAAKHKTAEYLEVDPAAHTFYEGAGHYAQAGSKVTVTPEFVLVGEPGLNRVLGFDLLTGKQLLTLDGEFHPDKPSGFGKHLLVGDRTHLVIGSPAGALRTIEGQIPATQNGVVSIFKHRRAQNIEGPAEFDWLGTNGVIVGSDLYIVSPHAAGGQGMLWRANLDKPVLEAVGNVRGSFASRFGASIATNQKVLAIGMPYYGMQTGQTRRGAVAIIELKH